MKCPVCGNETFPSENYEFDVCKECFWEYDPVQVENPDYSGGANCHSLNEYKMIYDALKRHKSDFSCKNPNDRDLIIKLDHADNYDDAKEKLLVDNVYTKEYLGELLDAVYENHPA